jgi:hypothetical protein
VRVAAIWRYFPFIYLSKNTMAPASTKTRKAALHDTSNARIDSYFKPCPPSTKRRLENDENTPCNDENRKKTPSPPSSQDPSKRQFGTIKPNGENVKKTRSEPLKQEPTKRQFGEIKSNNDENTKKTLSSSVSAQLKKQDPLTRHFGDIKYNDENQRKTPSPSNSQQQSLKRQFGDTKSNAAAYTALRLPLMDKSPKTPLKSQSPKPKQASSSSKRTPAFAVLCDEDIEKGVEKAPTPPSVLRVFRDSQDNSLDSQEVGDSQDVSASQGTEFDTQFIQEGDINNTQWTEVTSSPISVLLGDEDYDKASTFKNEDGTQDLLPIIVYNDKENATETDKENNPPSNDYEYSDEEGDSDLFPKTNEGFINFKPVTIDKIVPTSNNASQFFSDGEDDTRSETSPSFFDEEEDDEQAKALYNNNDNDFSVGVTGETSSLSLGRTLSPGTCETISQMHVPYNNPRGKDLWEKLGIEQNNNENESEDPESDNLPW